MMKSNSFCGYSLIITFFMLFLGARSTSSLTPNFYGKTCPNLFTVVKNEVQKAFDKENRMAASLLRLHFHDCFVNGCDGSILLDARDGEKISISNNNSARGFEVVDDIKNAVERECPGVVSCADILAIAARDSVVITRGPSWTVLLGRRDGFVSSRTAADDGLPSAFESLENITKKYAKVGLNIIDLVSSSGSHTIGLARCAAFSNRLYNFSGTCRPDSSMDEDQLFRLQKLCPMNGDEMKTTLLDQDSENEGYINIFGNHYFQNLLNRKSVLSSDQVLLSSADTKSLVELYSKNNDRFFSDFVNSMIKMGNISPPSGSRTGEIRRNCRRVN